MRALGRESKAKQWVRFAMKCGLLLSDPKMWDAVNEQMKERSDDVRDAVKQKYEDTTDRLRDARNVLQGRSDWLTSTASFLGGVGLGVGLGILFAPVSGEEARAVLRNKAADVKNKVSDFTTGATRYGSSAASTGTNGD
jgi:gas vesicle protein